MGEKSELKKIAARILSRMQCRKINAYERKRKVKGKGRKFNLCLIRSGREGIMDTDDI